MSMNPKRKGTTGVKAEGKADYGGLTPTGLTAGVVRRDVGLYEHVTGCEHTCFLGRKPKENESQSLKHKHMKPLPLEKVGGREEAVSLVKGEWP